MDCRKGILCCMGLLAALSGCERQLRPEGADQTGEQVIKKPETHVAFADYRVATAFAPETPADAQQVYREEARTNYLKAIEINPKHVPAYLGLARLQQGCHDMNSALETYQKALKVTAKDATIWYEFGMCQARQKQFDESVASLQKACELRPDDKAYRETLGYAMARAGRWEEGLTTLAALLGEARANLALARMAYHMEKADQARQFATAALGLDPNVAGGRDLLVALDAPSAPDAPTAAPNTPTTTVRVAPEGASGTPPAGGAAPHVIRLPPRPVIELSADTR